MRPLKPLFCCCAAVALAAAACENQPTEPRGDVMLTALEFTRSEASPGETLILRASAAAPLPAGVRTLPVSLQTNSGMSDTTRLIDWAQYYSSSFDSPWAKMSDAELTAYVAAANGEVSIGFKEAHQPRGIRPIDPNTGLPLVSKSTVEKSKQWLGSGGIVIRKAYDEMAVVHATMPVLVDLAHDVRNHQNVAYVEPNLPGRFESGGEPQLVSAIATAPGPAGVRVAPGDVLTATYNQPDGSRITANITIR